MANSAWKEMNYSEDLNQSQVNFVTTADFIFNRKLAIPAPSGYSQRNDIAKDDIGVY